jgi:hypothetical protein
MRADASRGRHRDQDHGALAGVDGAILGVSGREENRSTGFLRRIRGVTLYGMLADRITTGRLKMKRWLADFRLETTLVLPADLPELRAQVGGSLISIQNASDDEFPNVSLAAQIIVEADSLSSAEELARTQIREYFDTLSFVTSSNFRITRTRFVMDWTPGVTTREQYAYGKDNTPERWPQLSQEYTASAAQIAMSRNAVNLRNVVHWFSVGMRARSPEDQFQYLWFVIEILAELSKERQSVPDKCQVCHGELFCPACNKVSCHQPFAKQKIENLLAGVGISKDRIDDLFEIRNGLMHGRTRAEIEQRIKKRSPEFEISQGVDFIARCAFMSLFNAFKFNQRECEALTLGGPESVVPRDVSMKAHMVMGMHGDPNDPQMQNVVLPKITAIRTDSSGRPIDGG